MKESKKQPLPEVTINKLIEDNKDKMHTMAKALMEWETIDMDQINDIMEGRPPRPPKVPDQPYDSQPPGAGNAPAEEKPKAAEQPKAEDSDSPSSEGGNDKDGDKPIEAL